MMTTTKKSGRPKGASSCTLYKYKVTCENVIKYFASQPQIVKHYKLNRSEVYRMIHRRSDIKQNLKNHIQIEKLEIPLPMFKTTIRLETISKPIITHKVVVKKHISNEKIIY